MFLRGSIKLNFSKMMIKVSIVEHFASLGAGCASPRDVRLGYASPLPNYFFAIGATFFSLTTLFK